MKKKILFILMILSTSLLIAHQPEVVVYEKVNRDFQSKLSQLFADFIAQKEAQGCEATISFADNYGESRVTLSTAGAPPFLYTTNNYKIKMMHTQKIYSTKGVLYGGLLKSYQAH